MHACIFNWRRKIKKVVKEVVSRFLPARQRKKVMYEIKVMGDLVVPVFYTIPIKGTKDFSKLWLILEDE
jgi:hypothetical protein